MKQICTIDMRISNAQKNKNSTQYTETTFQILKPHAEEYRKLGRQYGLIPEYDHYSSHKNTVTDPTLPLEDYIKKMAQHSFVIWLNKQAGFAQAKSKILKENLLLKSEPGNEIIKNHRNQFVLEDLCSLIVYHFANNKSILTQIAVTKKKTKPVITAMKQLKHELKKGGSIFAEVESKQYLLQHLLEELLRDENHNVYSSKKNHPHILRQFLTKKFMESLFNIFGVQQLTHILVV